MSERITCKVMMTFDRTEIAEAISFALETQYYTRDGFQKWSDVEHAVKRWIEDGRQPPSLEPNCTEGIGAIIDSLFLKKRKPKRLAKRKDPHAQ